MYQGRCSTGQGSTGQYQEPRSRPVRQATDAKQPVIGLRLVGLQTSRSPGAGLVTGMEAGGGVLAAGDPAASPRAGNLLLWATRTRTAGAGLVTGVVAQRAVS